MTDKRQKATMVKCKREESQTKQPIFVEYSLLLKKHLSFAGARWQMNTTLYQNRPERHLKLVKFIFGTPWLPDLLYKHWFTSSVWNFCRWVADVPPRETSPAAKSEEKRMFSQATIDMDVRHSDREAGKGHPPDLCVHKTQGLLQFFGAKGCFEFINYKCKHFYKLWETTTILWKVRLP